MTENFKSRIKNTDHLLNIIDDLNARGIPENTILVSFDIVNMYPSIDNKNGIEAIRKFLNERINQQPSTQSIVEGLEIMFV